MAVIGSKLNRKTSIFGSSSGLSIVEVIIGVALLGMMISALNYFSIMTYTNIKIMKIESFVKVFNANIDQLFNSANACLQTMTPTNPIADGDTLATFRNSLGNTVLTFPRVGLDEGNVTLTSATVDNFINNSGVVRFNILLTYAYRNFSDQTMVKMIPIVGTVDSGLNILSCRSARSFSPETLFVRLNGNDSKDGDLTIVGNLTFDQLPPVTTNTLIVSPLAATSGAPAGAIFVPSDITLKKNIQPIDADLMDFSQVHSYKFKYKNSSQYSIGFLAQEVQEFSPSSVREISGEYLSVNYNSLLPYVWEYHKRVYRKNQELIKKLEELENRLSIEASH